LTGKFSSGRVELLKDQYLEINTNFSSVGDNLSISCNYPNLCESVELGGKVIFLDEIDINCEIVYIKTEGNKIIVKILNSGGMRDNSLIVLPFAKINIPTITSEDEDSITQFVLKESFDIIAVSFVRSATDIDEVKDVLGPRGAHIKVIAKIDNYLGIKNYDQILENSDGIMIARGRLCYELPEEKLIQLQKYMIDKAKVVGKPVITATQMLESMVNSPRPTLAEVSDVANAVLEGSDAVLLTLETSVGQFPIESLEMMAKVKIKII
jgi:pyruvate kinase